MPGRGNGRHRPGVPGRAVFADVYTLSSFGARLGSGVRRVSGLGGGVVFRDLSGAARLAARSGDCYEVGIVAIMTPSQARENFLSAMETLRGNKVRSALTVIGIIIGVSSVISMAAIISGLNKFVQDKVASLGSRTYFISRFPPGTRPQRWAESNPRRKYL